MEQNFSYYYIFNTVARCGNISKASKELYISQPAISKSIKKLEENLGATLFIRNSRGVFLSEEGKRLYEHTRHAFFEIEEGEKEIKRRNELEISQVCIGVSTTLCRFVLLPYLKEFVKNYPHVKIVLQSQPSLETIEQLEKGQLDVGLIVDTKSAKHLKHVSLGQIHDCFVATDTYLHNLRKRERNVSFSQALDYFEYGNIMLMDQKNMTRQHVEQYFSDNQIVPQHVLEVNSMDLLIEFAKIGIGISGVCRDFVKEELASGELVEIPLEVPIPERNICICYHSNMGLTRGTRLFLDYIQKTQGISPAEDESSDPDLI